MVASRQRVRRSSSARIFGVVTSGLFAIAHIRAPTELVGCDNAAQSDEPENTVQLNEFTCAL
jgi:hypothetical protein